MSSETTSAAERDEISRHRPGRCDGPHATTACIVEGHVRRCFECGQEWPCHDALVYDALAAENKAFREALEDHIEVVAMKREDHDAEDYEMLLGELADSARAALAQHGPEPSGHGAEEAAK